MVRGVPFVGATGAEADITSHLVGRGSPRPSGQLSGRSLLAAALSARAISSIAVVMLINSSGVMSFRHTGRNRRKQQPDGLRRTGQRRVGLRAFIR